MAAGGLLLVAVTVLVCLATRRDVVGAVESPQQHRIVVRLEPTSQSDSDNCTLFKQIESVLTAASQQLHNVSRGRVQWDRITVVLPAGDQHHSANECLMRSKKTRPPANNVIKTNNKRSDEGRRRADVVIHGKSHPLLADLPWAEQYAGCGQSGLGVHLSRHFVRHAHSGNAFLSGRQVLREWLKQRYGVFDESGFETDAQYPVWTSEYGSHPPVHHALNGTPPGNSTWQHNGCLTFRNSSNEEPATEEDRHQEANIASDAATNSSSTTTKVKASPAVTSIMASLQAEELCDGSSHIRWMPTKQNVLCDERSVWQVMETHADFLQTARITTTTPGDESETTEATPSETPFFAPEFDYVLPASGNRYVLVLDRSPGSTSRRWSVVRRALYRWIHALPDDSDTYLSVIVSSPAAQQDQAHWNSSAAAAPTLVLGWTKVTAENRDGLMGRIPRRPQPVSSHLMAAAVRLAYQMLNDEQEATCCGGQVILLSGSSVQLDGEPTTGTDVVVHSVAFPSRTALIAGPVNGLQLAVDDEMEDAATQSRLASALLQILRYDKPDTPTQVHEESVSSSGGQGTFTLDSPLGANVRVVAHCSDEADLDTVEVVSPSGRVYDLPLVSDGMLHIRIPHTDEFGEWSYRVRFAQPVTSRHQAAVEVTAEPSTSNEEAIVVNAWTSAANEPVNASQTAILVYAQVKRGQTPILDAKVTALIYPPVSSDADNRTVDDAGPFLVQLYDRGTGDPDITKADGIYSAYLTRVTSQAGHYAVSVQVTDNSRRASIPVRKPLNAASTSACCGSSMPYDSTVPVQPFRRIVSGPSFVTVDGPDDDQDVYPPSRIADLRVERIVNTTNEVELAWTAPGGDYDSGVAAFYQIRCYTDRSTLNDSSSAILVHASLSPQPLPAGTWQRAMVAVPWPNQLFYYAVIAVDDAGLRGKVSNIVPVYIEEPPPPPTTTTHAAPTLAMSTISRNAGTAGPEAAVHHQALTEHQVYAIAGGVAGFVLLLLILSVAACLTRRKSQRNTEKKSTGSSTCSLKIQVEPLKLSNSIVICQIQ